MYVCLNYYLFLSHLQNTWNWLPLYQLTCMPLLPRIFVLTFLSLTNLILVLYSKCLFRLITSLHRFIFFFCSWFCYLNTHSSILLCWAVMGFLFSLQCIKHVLSSSGLLHPLCPMPWTAFLPISIGCFLTLQLFSFLLSETVLL